MHKRSLRPVHLLEEEYCLDFENSSELAGLEHTIVVAKPNLY
jgi:hypothetical protein